MEDIKYWEDYNIDTSYQGDPSFSTKVENFDIVFEEAIETWNDEADEENQINNNQVMVEYDSDAMITKGITRIVCDCISNSTVDDCKEITPDDFMELGFQQLLSAQRRNGLGNLINIILTRFNTLVSNQNS